MNKSVKYLSILLVVILVGGIAFYAGTQLTPANNSKGNLILITTSPTPTPAQVKGFVGTSMRVSSYQIEYYGPDQSDAAEIYLFNGTAYIGNLMFVGDSYGLPTNGPLVTANSPTGSVSNGVVFAYFHIDAYDNFIHFLEETHPVYLNYKYGSYWCLSTFPEAPTF